MSTADLKYFRPGLSYRLQVELRDDEGEYVPINLETPTPEEGGYPDYFSALIGGTTVTIESEGSSRIFYAKSSELRLQNVPWGGNPYGFWDAPLPVSIKRQGDYAIETHTFSSWLNREVRLRAWIRDQDDRTLHEESMGLFLIERVETSSSDDAILRIVPKHRKLLERSAASIKDGGEWYKSSPTGLLMRLCILMADGTFSIDSGLEDLIDFGTLDDPRASSWGRCPGIDEATNRPSVYHFQPRFIARDRAIANHLLVGMEAPGSEATSGGAIAEFDPLNGKWRCFVTPSETGLSAQYARDLFPVFIWAYSDVSVVAAMVREKPAESGPAGPYQGFYELYIVQFYRQNGSYSYRGGPYPYWPCRFSLRHGSPAANFSYYNVIGSNWESWSEVWVMNGEWFTIPFPQRMDFLCPWFGTYGDDHYHIWVAPHNRAYYHIGGPSPEAEAITYNTWDSDCPMATKPGGYGNWANVGNDDDADRPGMHRTWFKTHFNPPVCLGDGTPGGLKWLWWIETVPTSLEWRIRRIKFGAWTEEYWLLGNMKDGSTEEGFWWYQAQLGPYWQATAPFWHRQIIAHAARGNLSGTASTGWRKHLVAVIEWRESQTRSAGVGSSPSLTFSRVCLWEIDCSGSSGSEATCSLLWQKLGLADRYNATIIDIHTPSRSSADDYDETLRYSIMGILLRSTQRARCFTVAIFDNSIDGFLQEPPQYLENEEWGAPMSSEPFAGFTYNHEDDRFHFVDAATGQMWSVSSSLDYRLENSSEPIHTAEHYPACRDACYMKPSGVQEQEVRIFVPMAPGPRGDVSSYYFEHPEATQAALRSNPGFYPLVMYSTKIADAIEVADLSALTVWKVLDKLLEMLHTRAIRIDGDGTFFVDVWGSGSPTYTLKYLPECGHAHIEDDEVGFSDYGKRLLYEDVINAVDVTPHELRMNPVRDPELLRDPERSTWGGEFLWDLKTRRPLRLRIQCVEGGDIVQSWGSLLRSCAVLFRWEQILDSIHCYLVSPCSASQEYIYLSGVNCRGTDSATASAGEFYAGDYRIKTGLTHGDYFQVLDGPQRIIREIEEIDQSTVRIRTPSGEGVGVAAAAFAEVAIVPRVSSTCSDSDEGLSETSVLISSTTQKSIPVRDAYRFRKQMVIGVLQERMIVDHVQTDQIVVEARGAWDTGKSNYIPAGTPVRAWIAPLKSGTLYEVGDTGALFGCFAEGDETDTDPGRVAARTLCPGDGILIRSDGFSLQPLEHAVERKVSSESIALYGRKDLQITDNRFVDLTRGRLLVPAIIALKKDPRIGLYGVRVPWFPGIKVGDHVMVDSRRISSADFEARVLGVRINCPETGSFTQDLTLKAIDPVTGAGAMRAAAPVVAGGRRRGRRGR